jgi:transmembrane sensor
MKKDIYHIASDYFNGRISENDLHFLQSWIAQSPENKLLLNELEQVWKMTGKLSFDMHPNVEEEWTRFVKERNNTTKKNIFLTANHLKFGKFLKVAAVFIPTLLVLSLGFFYLKNKGKTSEMVAINTANGKKECLLPDGTKVWINLHSNLIYPAEFSKNERVVKLDGEAFFEVVKGKSPFKITTAKTQVVVVGTAFNVRAYRQEKITEVIVTRGTVIFKDQGSNNKAILKSGDKGTYDESTKELFRGKATDFNSSGWKDELLSFHDTPLSDIETILSRYFNIPVQITPSMKQCRFTGEFKQPGLEEVVKVISVSLGGTYQYKNDSVFLQGKGCR